jgi:hypothetical protein
MTSLSQKIRDNVARSRRTTSEILGAAAVLVRGHEQILEQLKNSTAPLQRTPWTVAKMKQEFGSFRVAQKAFLELYNVRASSWEILVDRVNTIEAALLHLGYRERSM